MARPVARKSATCHMAASRIPPLSIFRGLFRSSCPPVIFFRLYAERGTMKDLTDAENSFRFKGVWWTEDVFTTELKRVLTLHRTVSNRRIAFHFGVTEKAVRKLRERSKIADGVILHLMAEAKRSKGKPVQYRDWDWYDDYPQESEARKIFNAAKAERARQQEIRYTQQQGVSRVVDGAARLDRVKAQRCDAVQRCKRSGLTQVMTADSLACSVRTVRRYW